MEDEMRTLRQWLTSRGFCWKTGRVVYHRVDGPPGWCEREGPALVLAEQSPLLDDDLTAGYEGPVLPRFIAEDKEALYFPEQYDGDTELCKVYKDLGRYASGEFETPYPGG